MGKLQSFERPVFALGVLIQGRLTNTYVWGAGITNLCKPGNFKALVYY
jgi:hypothetical protein